jgi:hypothetical protein
VMPAPAPAMRGGAMAHPASEIATPSPAHDGPAALLLCGPRGRARALARSRRSCP